MVARVASGVWEIFFLSAPFILLGLFLAGLLHVLLPQRTVVRWMGGQGLAAAVRAALLGIPLPICSCGIVPVAIALRRKGASRPATLSFLISTPESDVDAVALTWGLFGPLMALVRLVAAFLTSLVAAVLAIAFPPAPGERDAEEAAAAPTPEDGHNHSSHSHSHPHDHSHDLEEDGTIHWRELLASFRVWFRRTVFEPGPRQEAPAAEPAPRPFAEIVRAVGQRAFVEFVDDIVFWLALGLLAAGLIDALVPPELLAGLGRSLVPMLILLVLGVGMYICASASTPIAAALVAKGVSPGAALVFLLTGPATNAATLVLLTRHFGPRFVRIYLGSIAGTALACGLALDAFLGAAGLSIVPRLASEATGVSAFFQLLCALVLLALMVWRLAAGAARLGLSELADNLGGVRRLLRLDRPLSPGAARGLARIGAATAVAAWLLSGLTIVPTDSLGYGVLFGRVVRRDLSPGLHWMPPRPIGRIDLWRTRYARKADVGFQTQLQLVQDRALLSRNADPSAWHSPVAAMNTDPQRASYLAGDEYLLEMSFTVHFALANPYAFFYRLDKEQDVVGLYAEAAARELVATRPLDRLLTTGRRRSRPS